VGVAVVQIGDVVVKVLNGVVVVTVAVAPGGCSGVDVLVMLVVVGVLMFVVDQCMAVRVFVAGPE
jgi:hypothetical protein